MTKLEKQILALQNAAKNQPDQVKRAKIADKIKQIKSAAQWNKFLAQ